ncbi:unnamed protein product, partial [Mesorhabditis spiculigera]
MSKKTPTKTKKAPLSTALKFDPIIEDDDDDNVFLEFGMTPPSKEKPAPRLRPPPDEEAIDDLIISSKPKPPPSAQACPICRKDLKHLNDLRRVHHINKCLDDEEAKANFTKAKEKHASTFDCPLCRKPLQEGPFRITHLKQCAKEHSIPASTAVKLVDAQKKVADVRKENNLTHTRAKAPVKKEVKAKPLTGAPRSLDDEQLQLAKALSASTSRSDEKENNEEAEFAPVPSTSNAPQFTIVSEISRRCRKRRSYDVIAFTPESCACKQTFEVCARFVELFKVRTVKQRTISEPFHSLEQQEVTRKHGEHIDKLYRKAERLQQLSADFGGLADATDPLAVMPVKLVSKGGGFLFVIREILKRRTTILSGKPPDCQEIDVDLPLEILREWVRYIYSAKVEWNPAQNEQIEKIAQLYGPNELRAICRDLTRWKRVEVCPRPAEEAVADKADADSGTRRASHVSCFFCELTTMSSDWKKIRQCDPSEVRHFLCYFCGVMHYSLDDYQKHLLDHQWASLAIQLYEAEVEKEKNIQAEKRRASKPSTPVPPANTKAAPRAAAAATGSRRPSGAGKAPPPSTPTTEKCMKFSADQISELFGPPLSPDSPSSASATPPQSVPKSPCRAELSTQPSEDIKEITTPGTSQVPPLPGVELPLMKSEAASSGTEASAGTLPSIAVKDEVKSASAISSASTNPKISTDSASKIRGGSGEPAPSQTLECSLCKAHFSDDVKLLLHRVNVHRADIERVGLYMYGGVKLIHGRDLSMPEAAKCKKCKIEFNDLTGYFTHELSNHSDGFFVDVRVNRVVVAYRYLVRTDTLEDSYEISAPRRQHSPNTDGKAVATE